MSTEFAAATIASLFAASASANVINGGFEDPGTGFQSVAPGQTFGGWTNGGPGDIEFVQAIANPNLFNLQDAAFEGEYLIDLVGVGAPSEIYQDIAGLDAGSEYRIDWAQAGNVWGGDFAFTMQVLWNGVVVAANTQIHGGSDGSMMNWEERSTTVVAGSGSNRLGFRATNGVSARGAVLDAVSVSLVPAPASACVLMGVGLGALRRRKH